MHMRRLILHNVRISAPRAFVYCLTDYCFVQHIVVIGEQWSAIFSSVHIPIHIHIHIAKAVQAESSRSSCHPVK